MVERRLALRRFIDCMIIAADIVTLFTIEYRSSIGLFFIRGDVLQTSFFYLSFVVFGCLSCALPCMLFVFLWGYNAEDRTKLRVEDSSLFPFVLSCSWGLLAAIAAFSCHVLLIVSLIETRGQIFYIIGIGVLGVLLQLIMIYVFSRDLFNTFRARFRPRRNPSRETVPAPFDREDFRDSFESNNFGHLQFYSYGHNAFYDTEQVSTNPPPYDAEDPGNYGSEEANTQSSLPRHDMDHKMRALEDMGFHVWEDNVRALTDADYNLERAVQMLLRQSN